MSFSVPVGMAVLNICIITRNHLINIRLVIKIDKSSGKKRDELLYDVGQQPVFDCFDLSFDLAKCFCF